MRKCRAYEFLVPVISLVAECVDVVQLNWERYLCSEFVTNYQEVQDTSKKFQYSWLFLSIVLVTQDLLEDSQFPPLDKDLLEATKFASLWATKDVVQATETKLFRVLMQASIYMVINQKLQLSSTVFEKILGYAKFKVDIHCVYIQAWKDPRQKWFDLPYLTTDDAIEEVVKHQMIEWYCPSNLAIGITKFAEKKKKEVTKWKVQQLIEKQTKEVEEKVQVEVEHVVKQQDEQEECSFECNKKYPSPKTKEEEQSEQGGDDQEEQEGTPFSVKWYREQGKEGSWKKSKVTKPSLDPITLIDNDLDEIGDKVRDTTT